MSDRKRRTHRDFGLAFPVGFVVQLAHETAVGPGRQAPGSIAAPSTRRAILETRILDDEQDPGPTHRG